MAAYLRTWEESRRAIKLSPLPEPTDSLLKVMGRDLIPAAVAVIDPSTILDQPPATDNEQPAGGAPTPAEDIADEAVDVADLPEQTNDRAVRVRAFAEDALTGDQIEALTELLESLTEKELPRETIEALILAAFPKLNPSLVAKMLDGLDGFEPPEEEEKPEGETPEAPDAPEAEMPEEPMDEEMSRKRGIWERANAELDRTEVTYKATAEALFRAERPKVTREISSAQSFAEARQRVLNSYRVGGDLEQNWQESFTPLVAKTYAFGATEVAGAGAELAADTVESGLAGRSVQSVREAIRKRTQRLAQLIGDTTAREVLAVIEASERGGLTVTETARLVSRAVYGEEKVGSRSTAIARTESAGALSQGSWDQAKEMGDLYRSKEWLAFSDAETRESHTACMAQGRIAIDQPFQNGLMFPLDPSGSAAEVINCRCVLAYSDEPV